MANEKFITKWLEKKVKDCENDVLNEVKKIGDRAQRGFDNFYYEVASDDPIVFVIQETRQTKDLVSSTITCFGNQVLFIEFGAGVYNYNESLITLFRDVMGAVNPRPTGIDPIGEYHLAKWGISRGKDEGWFYKSITGRESNTAHLVKYNRAGQPIMYTHGNRPARILWRSVGLSLRTMRTKYGAGKTRRLK